MSRPEDLEEAAYDDDGRRHPLQWLGAAAAVVALLAQFTLPALINSVVASLCWLVAAICMWRGRRAIRGRRIAQLKKTHPIRTP